MCPPEDHVRSITEFVNMSLTTTTGLLRAVDQTDMHWSRDPSATQHCRIFPCSIMFLLNLCFTVAVKMIYYFFQITTNLHRELKTKHTTQTMAFRWPTKSLSVFQPSLSIIWAVGPPPFIEWAETRYKPSGDQFSLKTCVVPPH